MKLQDKELEQQLFHYAEGLVNKRHILTNAEVEQIEKYLQVDPSMRQKVSEIKIQLQWLKNQPAPVVPDNLTGQILYAHVKNYMEGNVRRNNKSQFHLTLKYASAFGVVLLVFFFGVWFGMTPTKTELYNDAYQQLSQQQSEWIEKVEDLYSHSFASTQYPNLFWLERFKATAEWLNESYTLNQDDYNTR